MWCVDTTSKGCDFSGGESGMTEPGDASPSNEHGGTFKNRTFVMDPSQPVMEEQGDLAQLHPAEDDGGLSGDLKCDGRLATLPVGTRAIYCSIILWNISSFPGNFCLVRESNFRSTTQQVIAERRDAWVQPDGRRDVGFHRAGLNRRRRSPRRRGPLTSCPPRHLDAPWPNAQPRRHAFPVKDRRGQSAPLFRSLLFVDIERTHCARNIAPRGVLTREPNRYMLVW